jgi:hypothetical protein
MMRSPDIEGEFNLFAGVRSTPVFSNYQPQHEVHENYQTSGHHSYMGCESVQPGETVKVEVRFITPQVYPQCIWEGRELRIFEGTRHVGNLRVTRLFNPLLRVAPEDFVSVWIEPSGLAADIQYKGWEND